MTAARPHRRTNHWRLSEILELAPAPTAAEADAEGRAHFLLRVARPHPVWWQAVLSRGTLLYHLLSQRREAKEEALGGSMHSDRASRLGVWKRPPTYVALRLSRRGRGPALLPAHPFGGIAGGRARTSSASR